jgi:DNA-directed RNA polymerase sigma subunit (sigma70/sigma32)
MNLTLREIGEVLGVSESRVSQIHAQLKTRIVSASRATRLCSPKWLSAPDLPRPQ